VSRAEQLAALRKRVPDSIAPDGAPLRFISVNLVKCLHEVRARHKRIANSQSKTVIPHGDDLAGADVPLPHVNVGPIHSGRKSSDHALGGHSQSDCFPVHDWTV
jgi:hypothetical protein